jgi:hypothetical protein
LKSAWDGGIENMFTLGMGKVAKGIVKGARLSLIGVKSPVHTFSNKLEEKAVSDFATNWGHGYKIGKSLSRIKQGADWQKEMFW